MIQLSVIIPHFNSEFELEKLLCTIPNEDWIEIIVIDDNSKNDILELEKKFDSVLFLKLEKEKKGAGAARNKGLKYSKGEYLIFADSDDYFLNEAFSLLKKYLKQNFDIVFFNPTSLNLKSNKKGMRHLSYSTLIENYIMSKNKEVLYKSYVPWSKLIKSQFVKDNKIEFDEVIASNDVNFSLKTAYYAKKIYCTMEQIYCVTESSNSLTKQISEDVLDSRFVASARYNDFLKEKGLKKLQGAMSGHLWNTRHFGFYKFLFRFFYCKYKKYPIFYDFTHVIKSLRHFK